MKILFIGGTGNISAACADLAHRSGHDIVLLNRGATRGEPPLDGVRSLAADAKDERALGAAIAGQTFDAVVQWIGYRADHIAQDIRVFGGRTAQYVFISSTAAYQKPPPSYVVTERTPLENPFWDYARDKIACEELLLRARESARFPVTIVRPSHTYGSTRLPIWLGTRGTSYTVVDRMRRGQKIVVPGDGTSLWTVTHSSDFAKGLVGLLGQERAIGEAFHITSDEVLTWNQIYREVGRAAGCEPALLHMATDAIVAASPKDSGTLLGDKIHSTIFDNAKIKSFVPAFACTTPLQAGLEAAIRWFDGDPRRQNVDHEANRRWDAIIASYERGVGI